jgi:Ca2+/Na+ antiporter
MNVSAGSYLVPMILQSIRMYVCICICMYVCTRWFKYDRDYLCVNKPHKSRSYLNHLVCMYVCIYVCMYVCMYVCVYIYIYMCVYVFIYVSIYVYVYIYVYTYQRFEGARNLQFSTFCLKARQHVPSKCKKAYLPERAKLNGVIS